MVRTLLAIALIMSGCASLPNPRVLDCIEADGRFQFKDIYGSTYEQFVPCAEKPTEILLPTHKQLRDLSPPVTDPYVIAVYSFLDKTGQRKSKQNIADFSTAVTQGGEALLIDALKTAGNGKWFRVVDRSITDFLVRERQIVKSTRQTYLDVKDEKDALQPLLFAGMIFDGGIIGYDTNIETGGNGARYLGIGASQQYRRDAVTVSLRAISVSTGEVLMNVQSYKTVLSVAQGYDVFRFVDMDTKLVEIEDGISENESVTYAVRAAIEQAVIGIIKQGEVRGYWQRMPEPEISEETNGEET